MKPSASDLALIRALQPEGAKPLSAEDVYVLTAEVANDAIDRDGDRFSPDVLADFARTLPGKGLLEAHNWGPVGVGRWFRAWLEEDATGTRLMGSAYLLREGNEELVAKIDGGIAHFVSVGFFSPSRVPMRDDSGAQYQEYRNLPDMGSEAIEASLVFLGAQHGAEIKEPLHAVKVLLARPVPVTWKTLGLARDTERLRRAQGRAS